MDSIEVVRGARPRVPLKAAILDFDGTLSLIREGWQQVMIPLFVDVLRATPTSESPDELERCVREFVDILTGKQTIYQCMKLAEEVAARGGVPLEPIEYKHEYHRRLTEKIEHRLNALRNGGEASPYLVPGTDALLAMLQRHNVTVYLASGTDEVFVREEASLLQLDKFCTGGIFGAQDDYRTFSKAMVIQRILQQHHLGGPELIGFGDGYVEIENVHAVGGFAVGVASNEATRQGVDAWKRDRLITAGADWIIPHYTDIAAIESQLFS